MIFKTCLIVAMGLYSALASADTIGKAAGDPAGFLKDNMSSNPKCNKCDLEPEEKSKKDGGSNVSKSDTSKGSGGSTNPPLKK
jgi:hypothetical protein